MDLRLKQRLVGAAVLVALAVVFIPMLLDETGTPDSSIKGSNIPPKPPGEFTSHIIPLDTSSAPSSGGPKSQAPASSGPAPAPAAPVQTPQAARPADTPTAVQSAQPAETPKVRVGVTAWVIQLGSFSSKEHADSLEARLRKEGYSAFVERIDSDGGAVYRVRVGPELLRAKADKLRDRLEQDVKLKGIVVRYP